MDIKKLEQLCKLREQGILTQEEFEIEKKKLLNSDIKTGEKRKDNLTAMVKSQRGVNWKNVFISFLIAFLWMFLCGAISIAFHKYINEQIFKIGFVVITAVILSFVAYKLNTQRYINCAPAWEVFIGVTFLQVIGVWYVIYQFLQIKQGFALIKDENTPKEKMSFTRIIGLLVVIGAAFVIITTFTNKSQNLEKNEKSGEHIQLSKQQKIDSPANAQNSEDIIKQKQNIQNLDLSNNIENDTESLFQKDIDNLKQTFENIESMINQGDEVYEVSYMPNLSPSTKNTSGGKVFYHPSETGGYEIVYQDMSFDLCVFLASYNYDFLHKYNSFNNITISRGTEDFDPQWFDAKTTLPLSKEQAQKICSVCGNKCTISWMFYGGE